MWRWADVREDVKMSRCEDEQMWRWADVREDVKMRRCERRCEDEQMWRWEDVREDVKMSRCEDEQMWVKMWRWADVKMSRCERRCEDEQMWVKMWRWADVKMRRCWEDVKMSRCERRCEDEQMFRRCEDEKMFYRPPLLEEPCAQTLSGIIQMFQTTNQNIYIYLYIYISSYINHINTHGIPIDYGWFSQQKKPPQIRRIRHLHCVVEVLLKVWVGWCQYASVVLPWVFRPQKKTGAFYVPGMDGMLGW